MMARGIEVMQSVPAGCIVVPVTDDYSAPHLRLGDFAVADTADRVPQDGDLFVIRWDNGWQQIKSVLSRPSYFGRPDDGRGIWMIGDLVRPKNEVELRTWLQAGIVRTQDGPYTTAHLTSKLVGRVVGVLCRSVESTAIDGRAA